MGPRHLFFFLAFVGYFSLNNTHLGAQETPRFPLSPASEETTRNSGVPPTPQFVQIAVDIEVGKRVAVRVPYAPAWLARQGPQVRLKSVQTMPPSEEDTAPLVEGGADHLYQVLDQALKRTQPTTAPAP
jgi:hypothetical protein